MTAVLVSVMLNASTNSWLSGCTPEMLRWITNCAIEYHVPVDVALRMAWKESRFDPRARRWERAVHTYSRGLMQLCDSNEEHFSILFNNGYRYDPSNWRSNARIGIAYLAYLHGKLGSWLLAAEAYEAGIGSVRNGVVPASTIAHARWVAYGEPWNGMRN